MANSYTSFGLFLLLLFCLKVVQADGNLIIGKGGEHARDGAAHLSLAELLRTLNGGLIDKSTKEEIGLKLSDKPELAQTDIDNLEYALQSLKAEKGRLEQLYGDDSQKSNSNPLPNQNDGDQKNDAQQVPAIEEVNANPTDMMTDNQYQKVVNILIETAYDLNEMKDEIAERIKSSAEKMLAFIAGIRESETDKEVDINESGTLKHDITENLEDLRSFLQSHLDKKSEKVMTKQRYKRIRSVLENMKPIKKRSVDSDQDLSESIKNLVAHLKEREEMANDKNAAWQNVFGRNWHETYCQCLAEKCGYWYNACCESNKSSDPRLQMPLCCYFIKNSNGNPIFNSGICVPNYSNLIDCD